MLHLKQKKIVFLCEKILVDIYILLGKKNTSFRCCVFNTKINSNKLNVKETLATSFLYILKFCLNKKNHKVQLKMKTNMLLKNWLVILKKN